jgi:hypothetical protein
MLIGMTCEVELVGSPQGPRHFVSIQPSFQGPSGTWDRLNYPDHPVGSLHASSAIAFVSGAVYLQLLASTVNLFQTFFRRVTSKRSA